MSVNPDQFTQFQVETKTSAQHSLVRELHSEKEKHIKELSKVNKDRVVLQHKLESAQRCIKERRATVVKFRENVKQMSKKLERIEMKKKQIMNSQRNQNMKSM